VSQRKYDFQKNHQALLIPGVPTLAEWGMMLLPIPAARAALIVQYRGRKA
jgi:hypothetical protein